MSYQFTHVLAAATFHEAFEQQAALTPKAPAVNCEHIGLTFEQLNVRANRIARRLAKKGVGAGSLIGLITARDPETIAGMLGIMKTGAAYVPFEPAGPKDRLASIAGNAALEAFVTVSQYVTELPRDIAPIILLDDESLVQEDGRNVDSLGDRSSIACITYVSSTQGSPKSVQITHGDLLDFAIKSNEVIYAEYPQANFRIGLKSSLTLPAAMVQMAQILFGRWLHILPDRARREVGKPLVTYISEYSINSLDLVPSDLETLLEAKLEERMPKPGILLLRTERVTENLAAQIVQNGKLSFYRLSGSLKNDGDIAKISEVIDINGFGHRDGFVDVYGYPVSLTEIEAFVRDAPAVRDAKVILQSDKSGRERIVAYVSADDDIDFRNALRRVLPEYMIPEAVIRTDAISSFSDLSVTEFDRQYVDGFVSPRNRVEDVLANMCCRILDVPKVGVFDNFFTLGGHSLLATQFVGQLQDYFPSEESLLSVFFQNPTIGALSAAILEGASGYNGDQIADMILQVMSMSDEEVEDMLIDKMPEHP